MTHSNDAAPLDVPAILASLTLEQKADLLDGSDVWRTRPLEQAGVGKVWLSDGPHGLRAQPEDGDHLGLLGALDAVCFPPAAAVASTWDTELLGRVGRALGEEARARGVGVLLGPGVNMKRSPLCGRNFEYYSEDPLLAGVLGSAFVRGVQSQGVGTSVKHFAANNQETDRHSVSADVDERTLREIYLPAFERVVTEAEPWTVMCAYNKVNGEYASQNRWLLTDVLRGEWGFDGLVVSDWGAVYDRAKAVHAGLDLEMPTSGGTGARRVLAAVEAGELDAADVDLAARRVLELAARARAGEQVAVVPADLDAHHALAREAATRSAVLLTNDGILPLDPGAGGTLAVVGELARTPRFQGGGSSQVTPTRVDVPLVALQETFGGRGVTFAPGYTVDQETTADETARLRDEAVAVAGGAAQVVVFLGLPPSYETEGADREHMRLPDDQVALLEAVAAANPHVVVVLTNGSVVETAPWQHHASALLETWLLGQAGGTAVADLLSGAANPSGRLAETVPLRYEDNPALGAFPGEHGHVRYGEGLLIGYRWYDTRRLDVAFPFGHGLSYTTFAYDDLTLDVLYDGASPRVRVALTVTNTGDRAGHEVVQVYVADPVASVFRPEQELRDFTVVHLEPGRSQRVELTLGARAFAFWHTEVDRWVVEPGTFEVRVGASSRDVRLTGEVTLAGEVVVPPLTADSTVDEWLAHPVVGGGLRALLGGDPRAAALFFDPEHGHMMRATPMRRISRFPGFPIDEATLEATAAQANEALASAR